MKPLTTPQIRALCALALRDVQPYTVSIGFKLEERGYVTHTMVATRVHVLHKGSATITRFEPHFRVTPLGLQVAKRFDRQERE
jgi:hypothetical protein